MQRHPALGRPLWTILILALLRALPAGAGVIQLTDNSRSDRSPAINRAGQVVWVEGVVGAPGERLYLWTGSAVQQLTGDGARVRSFQIDDAGQVVWETDGRMGSELFLWDGAAVRQLTGFGVLRSRPQISASGQVFWVGGCRPDGMGPDVYLWDGAAVRRLTARQQLVEGLQVNRAGQAVWSSWDGEDFEIYLWEGAAVRQISDSRFDDVEPQINNRGQVAWSGGSTDRGLLAREIYFWTGSEVRQITNNRLLDAQPQLNDAGQIVWQGSDIKGGGIYVWDGARIRQITNNSQADQNPRISQTGQVVWESLSSPTPNLFLWDGAAVRQLTRDNLQNGYAWDMNDGGQVVWHGFDGGDTEIYLWNGSSVVQLTYNNRSEARPRINKAGQVVWEGSDSVSDTEIYEYTPDASGSLLLDPSRILGSRSPTGTLFLGRPAPEGGAVVTLANDRPDVVTVPASVTIPAGVLTFPFAVTTTAVTEATPVGISASYGGTTWTATLTLLPVTVTSLSLCPVEITGGRRAIGACYLSHGATPDGTLVTLTSSDPAIVSLPASVAVTPGSTSGPLLLWTAPVTAPTPVVITASCGGVTRTAMLTVLPAAPASLTVAPDNLLGGASAAGVVTLTGPAPAGGAVVTLASDPPGVATLPESLVVTPGGTTAAFPIATTPVAVPTRVTVTATCGGTSQRTIFLVSPTTLASVSIEPGSVTGSVSASGRVTLTGPAPAGGTAVTLSSTSPELAAVPGTITVPEGETSAPFPVTTRRVKPTTMVGISASLGAGTRTATLTLLSIGLTGVAVRPGSVAGGGRSTGTVALSGPAPPGGALVTLTSAIPEAAAVPGSVLVPAGATRAIFPVSTSAVTAEQSVTLSATYAGVTHTTRLTVRRKR